MIEKHFSLDPLRPEFDHFISLNPKELTKMVESIRIAEKMMGSQAKEHIQAEKRNAKMSHRCLVANRNISAGSILKQEDIGIMRAISKKHGLPPSKYKITIGCQLRKNIRRYSPITKEDLL